MRYFNLYVSGTNDLFTYLDENDEYEVGMLVQVKFRTKEKVGIIVERELNEKFSFKVNPILRRTPSEILYDSKYIELLRWVKNYYLVGFSPIFTIGMKKREDIKELREYVLVKDSEFQTELEKRVKKYFGKKDQIKEVFIKKKFTEEELETLCLSGKLKFVKSEKISEYSGVDCSSEVYAEEDIVLNENQEEIKNIIINEDRKYFLIRGVTGSGKTEIYISLIKSALSQGKSSIFLVPEISLTPQMITRFQRAFGENVAIIHSKMSEKEISDQWIGVNKGDKKVLLGVRSAIFAPMKNLGYIIIDEEHETTYKQDSSPRYHAKTVALKRAEIEGCKVVLGSATPSIESYYYGEKNVFRLLTLDSRYNGATLPQIELVDMKKEENPYFSKILLDSIKDRLLKGEQVILLLNRKGYSTYIQCKDCGEVEECPHCSVKYSYYMSEGSLKCSYCGLGKKFHGACTKCGSKNILKSGVGVEKIEESLKEIFAVPVVRVDSDISQVKNFHEDLYHDFLNGKYKIMIGTQMITKGLHFPNVTLVGVINGDTTLNFPDFRSGERTFQLLLQVAGRAGRGDKKGEVIIQTYQPENKIYSYIIQGNYEKFYDSEIADRQLFKYPPFSKMINIGVSSTSENGLIQFGKTLIQGINKDEVEVYGPMKALVYKVKDRYRVNILIRGEREKVEKAKGVLREVLKREEGNKKFRVVIDIDPINLI